MLSIFRIALACLGCAIMAIPASSQPLNGAPAHITPALVAESDTPQAGESVSIAFEMKPERGWHGYWQNPGDAGLGMTLKWELPSGVEEGGLQYPVPETLLISGIMNHVYEESYAVLDTLKLSAGLKAGTRLPIAVTADWLACTDEVCVPERQRLTLDLVVGNGEIEPARRTVFDGYRAKLPRPLGVEARYSTDGKHFRLSVPFPESAAVDHPWFFALDDGVVDYGGQQSFSRNGNFLILDGVSGGEPKGEIAGVLKVGPGKGFSFKARPGSVPRAGYPVSATDAGQPGTPGGFAILAALAGAVLGGLLLNVMPCVFPILSLKALSLAKSGGEKASARRDALAYMAGAVVTCIALGTVLLVLRAGGEAIGWAFQLQHPEIILLLLALVTAISLNLAGLFELGGIGAGGSLAEKRGPAGSFWTGALAAFVATPCTGPFLGAALGAALILPAAASLAIFAGLGVGLALPFVLIAFVPALARLLPRPGGWMTTFRHIMAVPMFVTALALAWLLGRQGGVQAMTAGIAVALTVGLLLWWLGSRQRSGRSGAWAIFVAVLLTLSGGAAFVRTAGQQSPAMAPLNGQAIAFDPARLAGLRASGKPVFLYFTADWCITCKVNESAAIQRAEVQRAFQEGGVQVMVGDWTNADPAISRFLAEHGRSGVPLYLWYASGAEPLILPQILTPGMLIDLPRRPSASPRGE